jgi:Na+-translocating ferredoxin:NAD+ oxidoreductase RNF subunit RnfB
MIWRAHLSLQAWRAGARADEPAPPRKGPVRKSHKWLPVVNEDACTGCGVCVEACGPRCLNILDGVAVLVSPNICGSEEHCIAPCPEECIRMAWVPLEGDRSTGKWRTVRESIGVATMFGRLAQGLGSNVKPS